jgi:hypothetical protein
MLDTTDDVESTVEPSAGEAQVRGGHADDLAHGGRCAAAICARGPGESDVPHGGVHEGADRDVASQGALCEAWKQGDSQTGGHERLLGL